MKKLFSVLLVIAHLFGLLAVSASAEGGVQDASSAVYINDSGIMEHCLCGNAYVANADGEVRYRSEKLADGCIGNCDGTMLQWSPTATIPTTAGNWYLTTSYESTSTIYVSGNSVNLDLNGQTVTMNAGAAGRALRVNSGANLRITDSVGSGKILKSNSVEYTAFGSLIWLFGGNLDMYAGTIDGNNAACSADAGAMLVGSGSTFNMYGGTIQNGKGKSGGNIKVEGTLSIHDGLITGGAATEGGNIFMTGAGAVLNMYGGTVSGGTGSTGGGNLYAVAGGKVTMTDGVITGGSGNGNWGGNVTLYNDVVMTMSGGQIVDGIAGGAANNAKANMMIRNATLNISGGYVAGGISSFIVAGTINASGSAKIYNDKGGKQITLLDGTSVAMNVNVTGALNSDAKLMVENGTEGTVAVSGSGYTLTDGDVAAIQSVIPGYVLKLQDNKLVCAAAAEETYCVCGGAAAGVGNHVCQDVTWQPWSSTNSLPSTTGNYYLTAPVNCTAAQATAQGAQVSIDLRGYKVNFAMANATADPRCYHIKAGSVLNITDTVGGGAFVKDNTKAYTVWGSFLWVYGPSDNYATGGTLNLYAGTLDGNDAVTSNHSGVMLVGNGGTFNMYGGTVRKGKAKGGGNITLEGAMNLYAGTVTAGVAIDGSAGKEGGNIWIKETGKLNMSGGKITYGIAHNNWGGNVLVQGEMTMTGGEIYGGNENADGAGANLVLHGNGKLTMSGGHIHGRMRQFNSANTVLNVSGSAKIYNEAGGNQIEWYWDDSKQLKINVVGAFNEDAKILLNGQIGTVLPVADAQEAYAPYFGGNDLESVYQNGNLVLSKPGVIYQCVCGGKAEGVGDHVCQKVEFIPWANTTYLPSSTGNYYLTAPVNCNEAQATAEGAKVNIDLRGYKVNFAMDSAPRCYHIKAGSVLNITDSVGGGAFVKDNTKAYTVWGSFLLVYGPSDNYANGGTLNLYAGTLDGNHAATSNETGVMHIDAGGTFNMYGGAVKDGSATAGGNITVKGIMNLYAGTVTGGVATDATGGNIRVYPGGKLNVSGGEICDGTGNNNWGGNVLVQGEMTMTGGEIYGGNENADGAGANLVLNGNGKLTMSGGHIHGRLRQFNSANAVLNVSGSAKIYNEAGGNQIEWYWDDSKQLKINVVGAFNEDAKILLNGQIGTVLPVADAQEAYAPYFGGNDLESVYQNGNLVLSKPGVIYQCVCGGKAEGVGDHVCQKVEFVAWDGDSALPVPADFTETSYYYYLTKDVVCAQTHTIYGSGSIAIDLNGHTVTCSTAEAAHVYNWVSHGTLSITDSVGGGKVILPEGADSIQGKMIWIRQGKFNLYGGTLDGNNVTMSTDGAVVQVSSEDYPGVFNMYGGVICNGSAKNGGNIKLTNGAVMNLYAGTIADGKAQRTFVETLWLDGYGDNVHIKDGTLNIYGGTICGGTGESIYADIGGKVAMNGTVDVNGICLAGGIMDLGENFQTANKIPLNLRSCGLVANSVADYTASFEADPSYPLYFDGQSKIWYGGSVAAVDALGSATYYADLQSAVNAAADGKYVVKLLGDCTEDITVSGALYLDLNGFTLTGDISGSGTLYGMDSATDDYNCDDMGAFVGTISCTMPTIFKGEKENIGSVRRYMAIANETGYTFHRFYLGITKTSLAPSVTGVGYKAEFYGDTMVQAQVASYGYVLGLDGYNTISRTVEGAFASGKVLTLRVKNYDIANHADTGLSAYVVMTLNDGTVVESTVITYSFRQILEAVDESFAEFDADQKQAVAQLYQANSQYMETWDLVNIQAYVQTSAEVELTGMNIVYADAGDTTVRLLKNIAADVESETGAVLNCTQGSQSDNMIFAGVDSTLADATFRVSITQTGVSVTGADQLALYYGVLYLRQSVLTAPACQKAEGSWKIPAMEITHKVPVYTTEDLLSSGGTVNALWHKTAALGLDSQYSELGAASTQGGGYDGSRYVYQAYVNLVNGNGGVIACYDTQDSWKLVKTSAWLDDLGHGNDMTYCDGKLYISQVDEDDRKLVGIVDAQTLAWEGTASLQGNGSDRITGIAYSETYDSFVTYSLREGFGIYSKDFVFQSLHTPASVDLTAQGICCDDNYIYQILWDEKNRPEVSDAVAVFDWNGNLLTKAEIWLEFEQSETGEDGSFASMIESKAIYMIDGVLYGVFQDWENGVYVAQLQLVRG